MPVINVHISTSAPVLDMESMESFDITLDLFLDHPSPITFLPEASDIFDGSKVIHEGGLTFTDCESRIQVPRNNINICRMGCGLTLEEAKDCTITLRPGEKHTITTGMGRIKWKSRDAPAQPLNPSLEELKQWAATVPTVWKWQGTESLKDGVTYEIGIDGKASVDEWVEETKEELLERPLDEIMEMAMNMKKEKIHFNVSKPARFLVKRPDPDGSLDWM